MPVDYQYMDDITANYRKHLKDIYILTLETDTQKYNIGVLHSPSNDCNPKVLTDAIKYLYDKYDCQKVIGDFNITQKKTGIHVSSISNMLIAINVISSDIMIAKKRWNCNGLLNTQIHKGSNKGEVDSCGMCITERCV